MSLPARMTVALVTMASLAGSSTCLASGAVQTLPDGSIMLSRPNGVRTDNMGEAVAMHGDWLIAGEPGGDGSSVNTGNAIVYTWDNEYATWIKEAELGPLVPVMDLTVHAQFGAAVDIEGDYAVVGAPMDDTDDPNAGRAFIFERTDSGWSHLTTLGFGLAGYETGAAIDIDGLIITIGTPGWGWFGNAFTYLIVPGLSGTEVRFIGPLAPGSGPRAGSPPVRFGESIDSDGGVLVVGAPGDSIDGTSCGRAYAYQRDIYGNAYFEAHLNPAPSLRHEGRRFGHAVSADGSDALVGGPAHTASPALAGAAEVFVRDRDGQWSSKSILVWADSSISDRFGFSVDLHDDLTIIGAPGAGPAGPDSGTATIYRYSPSADIWTLEHELIGYDLDPTDRFGTAVAAGGHGVASGAIQHRVDGLDKGCVFYFGQIIEEDDAWQLDTRDTRACRISSGAVLQWKGDPTSEDSFGTSVAVDGDFALIGDPFNYGNPELGGGVGQIHAAIRASSTAPWAEDYISQPPNLPSDAMLGASVDIAGDLAVVGAPGEDGAAGEAWIYRRAPVGEGGYVWLPQQGLFPQGTEERFGTSVALTRYGADALIVIGAPADGLSGGGGGSPSYDGVAYIYYWDNSASSASLVTWTSNDGTGGEYASYGEAVDIALRQDGTLSVAVGNSWYHWSDGSYGCVELYALYPLWGGWVPVLSSRVNPSYDSGGSLPTVSFFGNSVALDETGIRLIAGARYSSVSKLNDGSAWIYQLSGDSPDYIWTLESMLLSPQPHGYDLLGASVAIHSGNGIALVGAPGDDYATTNAGAVHVYRYVEASNWWLFSETLVSRDAQPGDALGWSLSFDGTTALAGAPGTDDLYDRAHAVSFELDDAVAFTGGNGDALSDPAAWNVPLKFPAKALFSQWLADPYTVGFDLPTWQGSMQIVLDQIVFVLGGELNRGAARTITGDLDIASPGDIKSASLSLFAGVLVVEDSVTVGGETDVGSLNLIDARLDVEQSLVLNDTSSLMIALSPILRGVDDAPILRTMAQPPSLSGTVRVDLGSYINPDLLELGDRFTLISAGTAPVGDLFDIVVLPGLSNDLAFQLVYGAPGRRSGDGCPPGEIEDCFGNCCPAGWVGDGLCDDGTYSYGGHQIYLNCDTFGCDGGDCAPDNCWTVGGEWEMVIEVVSLSGLLDFGDPNSVTVDGDPTALEVVDLTDDGAEEICVTFAGSPGSLVIFENDGAGGVAAQIVIPVGDDPVDITSGDFDADGRTDLAVANNLSQDVWVFYNDDNDVTDGFDPYDLDVDAPPTCLAGIDANMLDGDDLVVGLEDADGDGHGYWQIYLGVGALRGGTMGPGGGIAPSGTPLGVDPSEDEDQKDFLFVGRQTGGKTGVGKNASLLSGITLELDEYVTGADPGGVTLGDLDGDGATDIATTSTTNNTVAILLQDTTSPGDFLSALHVSVGTDPTRLTSVDFDQDNNLDLAIVTYDSSGTRVVRVLQNDGSLVFTSIDVADGENVTLVDAGDVSGNGVAELVTVGGGPAFRGASTDPLLSLRELESATSCAGDTDGDNDVDIEDLLNVLSEFNICTSACSGDFDGDGDVDIEDLLQVIGNWGNCPR